MMISVTSLQLKLATACVTCFPSCFPLVSFMAWGPSSAAPDSSTSLSIDMSLLWNDDDDNVCATGSRLLLLTLTPLDRNTAQLPWQLASLQREAEVPAIQSGLAFDLDKASGVKVDVTRAVFAVLHHKGGSWGMKWNCHTFRESPPYQTQTHNDSEVLLKEDLQTVLTVEAKWRIPCDDHTSLWSRNPQPMVMVVVVVTNWEVTVQGLNHSANSRSKERTEAKVRTSHKMWSHLSVCKCQRSRFWGPGPDPRTYGTFSWTHANITVAAVKVRGHMRIGHTTASSPVSGSRRRFGLYWIRIKLHLMFTATKFSGALKH